MFFMMKLISSPAAAKVASVNLVDEYKNIALVYLKKGKKYSPISRRMMQNPASPQKKTPGSPTILV